MRGILIPAGSVERQLTTPLCRYRSARVIRGRECLIWHINGREARWKTEAGRHVETPPSSP